MISNLGRKSRSVVGCVQLSAQWRANQRCESTTPISRFNEEFQRNQIPISGIQKFILGVGSSLASILDPTRWVSSESTCTLSAKSLPYRHDMIACLGETTGESALIDQFHIMRGNEEGLRILDDRPRINTSTVDFQKLKSMPKDTFGYTYWKFLDDNVSSTLSRGITLSSSYTCLCRK